MQTQTQVQTQMQVVGVAAQGLRIDWQNHRVPVRLPFLPDLALLLCSYLHALVELVPEQSLERQAGNHPFVVEECPRHLRVETQNYQLHLRVLSFQSYSPFVSSYPSS